MDARRTLCSEPFAFCVHPSSHTHVVRDLPLQWHNNTPFSFCCLDRYAQRQRVRALWHLSFCLPSILSIRHHYRHPMQIVGKLIRCKSLFVCDDNDGAKDRRVDSSKLMAR